MAFSTYADLVSNTRDWLARDTTTLPDTAIGHAVTLAEAEIYGRLRVRAMEAAADLTFSSRTAALPTGFIGARRLYIDGSPIRMPEFRSPEQYWAEVRANVTGAPRIWTVEAGTAVIGPAPDQAYTGKLLYYARPSALSAAVNAIYTDNPDLFLYGTLCHVQPYTGEDDRLPLWKSMFDAAMQRVQAANEGDRFAGTPLVMRPG